MFCVRCGQASLVVMSLKRVLCGSVEVAAYYRPAVHSARKHEGRTIARVNFAQRHAVSPTPTSPPPASRPSLSLDVSLRPPERTNERPTSSSTVVAIASLQHSPAITSGRIHPGQSDTAAAAAAAAGGAGVGGGAGDCVDADRRTGGTPIDRATRRLAGLWKPIDPLARFTPARLPKTQDRSPRTVVPTPRKSPDSPVSDFNSDLILIA